MNSRAAWFLVLAALVGCGLSSLLPLGGPWPPDGAAARADEPRPSASRAPVVPEYVSRSDVVRVCQELNIRDWTRLAGAEVTPEEAKKILAVVQPAGITIDPEDFQGGLQVELEHGFKFPEANVTNNHPILTGRIVMAHLLEIDDYYERLKILELEADLFKALRRADADQARGLYRELAAARISLSQEEAALLGPK